MVHDAHVVTQANEEKDVSDAEHRLPLLAILTEGFGRYAVLARRTKHQEFPSFQARLRKCLIRSVSLPQVGSTTGHEAIFARSWRPS